MLHSPHGHRGLGAGRVPGAFLNALYVQYLSKQEQVAALFREDPMKLGAILFLAFIMPFGFFVLAGMAGRHLLKAYRRRPALAH